MDVLKQHVSLLDDVPMLKDTVFNRVLAEYKSLFQVTARRAARDTGELLAAQSLTMDLSSFASSVRAIACCPLPEDLVPVAAAWRNRHQNNNSSSNKNTSEDGRRATADHAHGEAEEAEQKTPNRRGGGGRASDKRGYTRGGADVKHTDSGPTTQQQVDPAVGDGGEVGPEVDPAIRVLAQLPHISMDNAAENFALMAPLPTTNVSINELGRYRDSINQLGHAVARFSNCRLADLVVKLLTLNVGTVTKKVDASLRILVDENVIARIFGDKVKAAALMKGADTARHTAMITAKTRLQGCVTAAHQVNSALEGRAARGECAPS